ncbi:MAG: fumarylacetoacetate hydrolase family protein [Myxococcales bacterium]|nr:fumarylacetoacetate hydrolase family protein [Myxococcales bacterium]
MKLATLADGTRDGHLVLVNREGSHWALAADIAVTMQKALDDWTEVEPRLRARANQMASGIVPLHPLRTERLMAPLPRAYEWIDSSSFLNHVRLVRKARGMELPQALESEPLVYQGGSGSFLGPRQGIPLSDESWGLDFEAEVCVVLGDTPQGIQSKYAEERIRLVTLCNDVSLRGVLSSELGKGFGYFQGKPATAFAPFLVTCDEVQPYWKNGRLDRDILCTYNGELISQANAGEEMHFSFPDLVQYIAKTRKFCAGTILGSGTVSNTDGSRGTSCLAERRMRETIEYGEPKTPFMKVGDTIRIEMLDDNGVSLFGAIDQEVVAV